MRTILGFTAMVLLAVMAWNVGALLSADAVAMGVGLVFGVLSGIPTALLVLAAGRQRHDGEFDADEWRDGYRRGMETGKLMAPFQAPTRQRPPVIIVHPADDVEDDMDPEDFDPYSLAYPFAGHGRQFRITGEGER